MLDSDPTLHFDADPDPNPDPTQFYTCRKIRFFFFGAVPVYEFYLSRQRRKCHINDIVDSILTFSRKNYRLAFHLVETDTYPDGQALDADSDPQHC